MQTTTVETRSLVDLLDEPLIGLAADGALADANAAAWRAFARGDTLVLKASRPRPTDDALQARWCAAIGDACAGRRRLLWSSRPGSRSIALHPGSPGTPVVVRVGRDGAGLLRMLWAYGHAIGLTAQETRVLEGLADGEAPAAIAAALDVKVSTVRSQVSAIISKAGVRDTRELIAELARLIH